MVVAPGEKSPEELVKDVQKGIFVTSLLGGNSDSTRGDFSHGVRLPPESVGPAHHGSRALTTSRNGLRMVGSLTLCLKTTSPGAMRRTSPS